MASEKKSLGILMGEVDDRRKEGDPNKLLAALNEYKSRLMIEQAKKDNDPSRAAWLEKNIQALGKEIKEVDAQINKNIVKENASKPDKNKVLNQVDSDYRSAKFKYSEAVKSGDLEQQLKTVGQYKLALQKYIAVGKEYDANPRAIQASEAELKAVQGKQKELYAESNAQKNQARWEEVREKSHPKPEADETLGYELPKNRSAKQVAQDVRLAVGSKVGQAFESVREKVKDARKQAQAKQDMKNIKLDDPFGSEDSETQSTRSRSSSSSSPPTPRFTRGGSK